VTDYDDDLNQSIALHETGQHALGSAGQHGVVALDLDCAQRAQHVVRH
jgi:hypothetical protein